jgi:DNA-binding response OmpR family regulator
MTTRQPSPVVLLDEVPPEEKGPYKPVILVVDDESAIANTLAEILSRSGYAAMAVYDGNEALETALVMPPELLIADVLLPGMSGVELAITVRRIFPECKILLFSGQASTADLLAAAKSEGHHFTLLTKPIHPRDLLAHVSRALAQSGVHVKFVAD